MKVYCREEAIDRMRPLADILNRKENGEAYDGGLCVSISV